MPSGYMPLIFGNEGMTVASLEEANQVLDQLMALWNRLVASESLIFPHKALPQSLDGLREKIAGLRGRVKYFVIRQVPRIGRNEPCPCGSGRKYKQCCERP